MPAATAGGCQQRFRWYGRKLAGPGSAGPARPAPGQLIYSGLQAFIGMLAISGFHYGLFNDGDNKADLVMTLGSQGATSVLVFAAIGSPLAQPRNVVGGNIIAAFIGVAVRKVVVDEADLEWLAVPLSVGLAIIAMELTRTLHPPAGATALIAVIGGDAIQRLGWWYILIPVAAGSAILIAVAAVFNNLAPGRQFPSSWFGWEVKPRPPPPDWWRTEVDDDSAPDDSTPRVYPEPEPGAATLYTQRGQLRDVPTAVIATSV